MKAAKTNSSCETAIAMRALLRSRYRVPISLRRYSNQLTKDNHNAFISKRKEETNSSGSLAGLKAAVKDNFVTTKEPTTSGSEMLRTYMSPFDATTVSLIEASGAKVVGKTNMDEFGMGSSNTNSAFGSVVNPMFPENHISGGSSGGSAAAVALREADFALGTDTGGSVRLPASYCGVHGFKPTYGRISRWGVIAYAQSLDTVGIFARDLDTVRSVFDVLDVADSKDPTCFDASIRHQISHQKNLQSSKVIGVPEEFVVAEMTEEAKDAWNLALCALVDEGYEIRYISIPTIKKLLLAYYTIATAEAASNLSRYEGIRYGYSISSEETVSMTPFDIVSKNRSTAFGSEVQRRIILGNYTLSSDSGNHYLRATHVRKNLVAEFNKVFSMPNVLFDNEVYNRDGCCALLCPTAVSPAPSLAEYTQETNENFLNAYINDILTVPASLAGLPSISIPYYSRQGIQIMGQFGDDETVLKVAKTLSLNCTYN